jgi:nucleoside-diphosphate-sugar epimerase
MSSSPQSVLVTGGAGYVGSVLVPKLLAAGHRVTVLDLFLYGDDVLAGSDGNPNLTKLKGDIRNLDLVEQAVRGADTVIHLACISNDPSFELDPDLGKSINFDCFRPLVRASKRAGVKRFIYASSSSVYGIKDEENVTEELALDPLTDYSRFKADCETVLAEERTPGFTTLVIRPATVCGDSPRLRLDLTVNILTNHAVHNGVIKVFGGTQRRPNIHIEDMTDLYVQSLDMPADAIDGRTFNAGYENHRLIDIADIVRRNIDRPIEVTVVPTDDLRSYHISSELIRRELGFVPKRTIDDAVRDLVPTLSDTPDSLTNPRFFNIKTMQKVSLK